jgi:hypothetical protein
MKRSVMSNRASPRGNPKLGPEAWCDIIIQRGTGGNRGNRDLPKVGCGLQVV